MTISIGLYFGWYVMKKQLSKTLFDIFGVKKEFSTPEIVVFNAAVLVVVGLIFFVITAGL